jgi:peptidoglycan-associated lipoprotein
VLIEGHCDERGTNEYNLALGERRAKSTMNYLVSQGVQASRITIISYGEERPVCNEKTEECWAKNRRAHFLVKPR